MSDALRDRTDCASRFVTAHLLEDPAGLALIFCL